MRRTVGMSWSAGDQAWEWDERCRNSYQHLAMIFLCDEPTAVGMFPLLSHHSFLDREDAGIVPDPRMRTLLA